MIHEQSARGAKSFVDINCAALPDALLESELFGYEKGAFTGAGTTKKGLFETAEGGTLFLDEIGEMRPELQAKLLTAIEKRKSVASAALRISNATSVSSLHHHVTSKQ
jgi:transcriptional regulator with PAS, ATPase and Fis domain